MSKKTLPENYTGHDLIEAGFEILFCDEQELIVGVPAGYDAPARVAVDGTDGVSREYNLDEDNQEDGEAYYRPVAARPRPTLTLIQGGRT